MLREVFTHEASTEARGPVDDNLWSLSDEKGAMGKGTPVAHNTVAFCGVSCIQILNAKTALHQMHINGAFIERGQVAAPDAASSAALTHNENHDLNHVALEVCCIQRLNADTSLQQRQADGFGGEVEAPVAASSAPGSPQYVSQQKSHP